jgi:hypothetical protein
MKRVGPIVDNILVTVWSFLILFFATVLLYQALPARWQPRIDTNAAVVATALALCAATTSRFLVYMEYPQWVAVPTFALVALIYWLRPGAPMAWGELGAVAVAGTMIVLLIGVPLHRWGPIRIKMRVPWQRKPNKAAKLAREALELRARIESK